MMRRTNRRRFLCLAGGSASLALAAGLRWSGRAPHRSAPLDLDSAQAAARLPAGVKVTRTSLALGAEVSLTAFHADGSRAEAAVDAAFAELERVEDLMSIYRPQSQLSRLNRTGLLTDAHPYLLEVLQKAAAVSHRSGGAFDVTVQPFWALYAQAQGETPEEGAVKRAAERVDWRYVQISGGRVRLQKPGVQITLNGIAQGYAADRALWALRTAGVRHALVDTGELASLGQKPGSNAWRVGIQHPRVADAYLTLAALDGRCLATSGDYATTFREDKSQHHLFDPRSGRSPVELASVSVAANTAMEADALSTAVFVMGPSPGLQLVRATAGADAMLVTKGGETFVTRGFPLA